MRGKKNEFRKDEGVGEFAHVCAKFKCFYE